MDSAIFLAASVPDPQIAPRYAATADTVAITAAVSALVYVTLGRRMLVWGGHPAITPMIWVVAEDLNVDYSEWVRLYQSRYFEDDFPEDNDKFNNVAFVESVGNDREESLLALRERMFSENRFSAAVFIGGMEGVISEFEIFRRMQPGATIIPVATTGGASREIAERFDFFPHDATGGMDYVSFFHKHLGVSVREERFRSPQEQPNVVFDRHWKATNSRLTKRNWLPKWLKRSDRKQKGFLD